MQCRVLQPPAVVIWITSTWTEGALPTSALGAQVSHEQATAWQLCSHVTLHGMAAMQLPVCATLERTRAP